jgi:hypothetical protein
MWCNLGSCGFNVASEFFVPVKVWGGGGGGGLSNPQGENHRVNAALTF